MLRYLSILSMGDPLLNILDKVHAALLFKINLLGFTSYVSHFNEFVFDVGLDFDLSNIEHPQSQAVIILPSIDVNYLAFAETLSGEDGLTLKITLRLCLQFIGCVN